MTANDVPTRRTLLASIATSAAVGLAGCLTGDGDGSDGGSDDGESGGGDDDGADGDSDQDGGGSSGSGDTDPLGPSAWPMRNFDAAQTGSRSDVSVPSGSLNVEWSLSRAVDRHAGDRYLPIHAGSGYVVIALPDGRILAVDAETGDVEWTYELAERASKGGGIALYDGVVYASAFEYDADHPLYALDVETGDVQWEVAAGDSFDPVIYGGGIFGAGVDGLQARERSDGSLRWEQQRNTANTVAVDEGVVYSHEPQSGDTQIVANDAGSGDRLWATDTVHGGGTNSGLHCSVADGTVYATNQRGTVFAFETGAGAKEWEATPYTETETRSTDTMPREAPVVGDEHVFVGGFSVHALSRTDGAKAWSVGQVNATRDYMGYIDGELLSLQRPGLQALNPSDGSTRWSVELPIEREGCLGDVAVTADRIYVSEDRCIGEDPQLWAIGGAE